MMRILMALVSAAVVVAARAEDYNLLKTKVGLLVDQSKEFYDETCRKDSYVHDAQYQYYFMLMHGTGTNLLAQAESPTNEKNMRKYFDLVKKDYEAYTKVVAATDKAAATGRLSGNAGDRHRAKRLVNAEKLRDKELTAAIKRWEKFVDQLNRTRKQ